MIYYEGLSTENKLHWSEIVYLFLITVVSPFFVGLEVWDNYSFTFSLIFVNLLQLPAIILFYRWLLPKTLMAGRIWQFLLFLPLYLLLYELNSRIATIITIHSPFVPEGYKNLLIPTHPEQLNWKFNQSIGYTCLVLLTASSLALMRSFFKEQEAVYKMTIEKVKLELEHLKSQVQPHFFFNTLNNLYALSVQKSDKTPVMIASLSSIMRYVLYDSQREYIALEKELNFIQDYIGLERLRHTVNNIELTIQGKPDTHQIPPLLFLPLIENCFKHATTSDAAENIIKIILVIQDQEIVFQSANKKRAIHVQEQGVGGIGLENVKKRLNLLYPGKHHLHIDETEDNFELVLTLITSV